MGQLTSKSAYTDTDFARFDNASKRVVTNATFSDGKLNISFADNTVSPITVPIAVSTPTVDLTPYAKTADLAPFVKTADLNSLVSTAVAANVVSADSVAKSLASNSDFATTVSSSLIQNQKDAIVTGVASQSSLISGLVTSLNANTNFKTAVKGDAGTVTANSGFTNSGNYSQNSTGTFSIDASNVVGGRFSIDKNGAISVGGNLTAQSLYSKNPDGKFSHFNYNNTGVNYLRGDTIQDNGKLFVNEICIGPKYCIASSSDASKGYLEVRNQGDNSFNRNL